MSYVMRRIVGLVSGVLVTVGLMLEDLVDPPPVTVDTDSCLRCRGSVVTTPTGLSMLPVRTPSDVSRTGAAE